MKIVVCIRQSVSGEINPFDACCLESALSISGAEVIILSMGPSKTEGFLENLTRLGVDRAILLCDNAFAGSDTLATSYILSLAIDKLKPDFVFCGRQTVDGDTGQVGPEISFLCDYQFIPNVMKITNQADNLSFETRNGENYSNIKSCLITLERINALRLPSIFSTTKFVEIWDRKFLNADLSRCGFGGSPTKVIKTFENNSDYRRCEFIGIDKLDEIIKISLETEKIHISNTQNCETVSNVWSMGELPYEMAKSICKDVKVIPITDAKTISEKILKEKPNAVIWGSDILSKKIAATVAARLKLGLCADCIKLETDGNCIFMYRPAFSGSIIAKITSDTSPVMATVRTVESENKPIVIGVGYGAKDYLDKVKVFADKYNAETVASRILVDHDFFAYDKQVGLTGKTISPKVYIALGISGAVHHIAGIRKSETIIAINSDKDAPIFKYADYGIIDDVKNII